MSLNRLRVHFHGLAAAVIAALIVVLGTTGCVSKKRLEQCEQEKGQLEEKVAAWEARFDREAERWESVGTSVTEALPAAIGEMHAERQRILELVPAQVQTEVESYLDEYFDTVMKGFRTLKADNDAIRRDLEMASLKLEAVGADTSDLKDMSNALDEKLDRERAHRSELTRRVAMIADRISQFDGTKINCRDCPDRLRLNRKEREAIGAFHKALMTDLAALQAEMQ